jgi:hypothetical protein
MTEKRYVLTESQLNELIGFANDDYSYNISIGSYDDNELTGETSDGYHTFNDLYEHRNLLFVNLLQAYVDIYDEKGLNKEIYPFWSKKHDDGSMFEGYVIAGMLVRGDAYITYHLQDRFIDLLKKANVIELDKAPAWDGHTSADVLDRLRDNL